jgi:hypothetical protein
LYDGRTTQELIQQKNEIFAKAIPFIRTYRHRGSGLSVRIDSSNNSAFVLSIASQRALTRETPDFRVEQVDNWPHTVAIVLNREDEQYVAVQDRPSAFASTDTVINLIEKATRTSLAKAGLRVHFERMFHQSYFWSIVADYRDRITLVGFDFVTPNMANISNTLSDTLKRLAKDTNTAESNLQLRSDPASALELRTDDETVQGLVDYTSEGGGDIYLKVKGIRKRIHTSHSTREIQIDDLELSGSTDQLAVVIRKLLK